MNSTEPSCNCSEDGYSPDCPQAFVQNGQILHILNNDNQLKPRKYQKGQDESTKIQMIERELKVQPRQFVKIESGVSRYQEFDDSSNSDENEPINHLTSDSAYQQALAAVEMSNQLKYEKSKSMLSGNFQSGQDMMKDNREVMKKFEALKIGDQSLTSMSIGGYAIDLRKAAQKAKEVAPLPPAKLPIIFKDSDMNFYHHFFQGLEMLIGRSTLIDLVNTNAYFNEGENLLYGLIEEMIKTGYERSDTELTVFTKTVLTSTFSIDESSEHCISGKHLVVDANLWGLQYIESGMQCKEADLKMWLSICYSHYRMLWFNTFKSSGIPAFALEGVQSRYEEKPIHRVAVQQQNSAVNNGAMDQQMELFKRNIDKLERSNKKHESRSSKHRHSKKERSSDSVIDSIFGSKK
jgi:hypothetical protein